MYKKALMSAVSVAMVLGFSASAFAATATNIKFQNGDTAIQGTGGTVVNAKVHLVVPINETVEKLELDVLGDNLASVTIDVGGDKGLEEGTYDQDVQFTLPPNTGNYTVTVKGCGLYGPLRTVDCSSNVVLPATPFAGALKVVASNTTSSSNSSSTGGLFTGMSLTDMLSWLTTHGEVVAAFRAILNPTPTPTPAPAKPACPPSGVSTLTLQGWLVDHRYMTEAQVNTGPGIYGPKTIAAQQVAMLACQ